MATRKTPTQTGIHAVPVFDKTIGVIDKLDPLRISEDSLAKAENVVIDVSGGIARRSGCTVVQSGACHSLFSCGKYGLGVFGGVLKLIEEDFSLTSLVTIGESRAAYARSFDGLNDVVYFVSVDVVGKVVNKVYSSWTTPAYVGIDSTDAQVKDYLSNPPKGQLIGVFNGRLYIANKNIMRYSELYDFSRFASQSAFVFDSDISMMECLASGIYVGTENNVVFLQGADASDFRYIVTYGKKAILGTSIKVTSTEIGLESNGEVVVFSVAGEGICIGTAGGEVMNLTSTYVEFLESSFGACCITTDKQYIVSLN